MFGQTETREAGIINPTPGSAGDGLYLHPIVQKIGPVTEDSPWLTTQAQQVYEYNRYIAAGVGALVGVVIAYVATRRKRGRR